MSRSALAFFPALVVVALVSTGCGAGDEEPDAVVASVGPALASHQPELFSAPGAQPNAWADYDLDGDLDLFVGFRSAPNRLYRNDAGMFVDVAGEVGVADEEETRAAAWGDYDGDGDPDLYVGFRLAHDTPNRLYRNDAGTFVDVAAELGVVATGNTRQPAFVDYDGDGDLDLFVAFRDQANRLWRQDDGVFTDVTEAAGLGDSRRTVGAVWFDMDGDGDLDLFCANQNGDEDAVYLNDGAGRFEDAAERLGMHRPGRSEDEGSVGVAVSDYDADGDVDLFVASYGPDVLWQNQGDGTFLDVAPGTPLADTGHAVAAGWGDADNDGWPDLYVGAYVSGTAEVPDRLLRNEAGAFQDATPAVVLERGASHGVSWADFDLDGDLDLALANNHESEGTHPLYRNDLPTEQAVRSLQVLVLDGAGGWTRAGATVVVTAPSPDGGAPRFRSARTLDAGGGYGSQSAMPVHFGIPEGLGPLNVRVQWFEGGELRFADVAGVDPARFRGQWLVLRLGLQ